MATKKGWYPKPVRKSKPKVPDSVKVDVQTSADKLVNNILIPKHIKPRDEGSDFSYLVEITTKWYRNYFYFQGRYRCVAENCISEFFDTKFARIEYVGENRYNLSYMRHTQQWWEIYKDLSLDNAMSRIGDGEHFRP
jgi:hypothetical protein